MAFDYDSLPRLYPRRYVPEGFRFEWDDISRQFNELESRELGSASDFEKWIEDESEFESVIYEQRTIRYINSTRQTDNPEYRNAFEEYTEGLEPKIKLAEFKLLQKFVASPLKAGLNPAVYSQEVKRREAAVAIFREENVGLEKDDSMLSQEYQRTTGAMTVHFRGQEFTLQQMSKFYEETSRELREEAWKAADDRALQDAQTLDSLYGKMVALRDREAKNAGFKDYRDYIFAKKFRFDYTPDDCIRFHEGVEKYLVPLSREIDRERGKKMGIDELRPWDMRTDPEGRAPLTPFNDSDELVAGCKKALTDVDGQFGAYFSSMVEFGVLDLESRKGKAPGGYQDELSEVRLPFIFMNAAKRDNDVRTLLHESGHSFHSFLMRDAGIPYFNGNANLPTEFAEVASTTMELISGDHLEGSFYTAEQARRSNKEELVSMVKLFTWVATIDAYQHWVYTHPDHSEEERARAWVSTFKRFCGLESYEGLERSLAYRWQRQLHLFEVPFYYIEYGIASTGALGIWARYREDRRGAVQAYKDALSLGASKSLPELFGAASVEWDFGPKAMSRVSSELSSAIKDYS